MRIWEIKRDNIVLLVVFVCLVGCTTMRGSIYEGSADEINARETVAEYILEKIEYAEDYKNKPCSNDKDWWCVGRMFTEKYEIIYVENSYGYIFYSIQFDNGNHLIISTEHLEGEWKVTQKPIRAGENDYYVSTHSKGKKFKIIYVKSFKDGTVDLKASIEK